MQLVDTHCHIHSDDYSLDPDEVIAAAAEAGVTRLLCVGTTAEDSERAVEFVQSRPHCWAAIGLHPHDAKDGEVALQALANLMGVQPTPFPSDKALYDAPKERIPVPPWRGGGERPANKIVAIGECGLDYFYGHSSKADQETALRFQIELALAHDLPLIFHVRDAFEDFWPIFDSYSGIRGVLHSFTDTQENLDKAVAKGLYIGVNGIATFTKNDWQRELFSKIPASQMILETDAPFLTPVPLRGKVNQSAYVIHVCQFLADLRQEPVEDLASQTTQNALTLFKL